MPILPLTKPCARKKADDRDRRFITELVYGTIKAKGTLDWLFVAVIGKGLCQKLTK